MHHLQTICGDSVISTERATCLVSLQERLGYHFRNLSLLNCALIHKSYAHETGRQNENYERLEFLGDAVLDLIVSDYLYTTYPASQEGRLSKLRSEIVSESGLTMLANHLRLGCFLLLGRGEEQTGGRHKASLLSAAFEAVMAAIYLDSTLSVVKNVFLRTFTSLIGQRLTSSCSRDYKGLLQAYALGHYGCLPIYHIVREEGPAHQKIFHVQLSLARRFCCDGVGRSKKAAEQHAAKKLLQQLSGDASFS
jgi:ribonuclease-3